MEEYEAPAVIEKIKQHQQNKKLVASELGDLFTNYLGDSLFCCIFKHHLHVVEDDDVKQYIESALRVSQKHLHMIENIFKQENIPVPVGFGKQDLHPDAPRLFSDIFMVFYMTEMSRAGFETYGSALSTSARHDIIQYFETCLQDTISLYKHGMYLLLEKGMDITSPEIPYPKKVDFVEKPSFISAIAGKSRPLTSLEIKHLQININTNTLGKALMVAFSQIASSAELRSYFREGCQLAEKQINDLSEILMADNLPSNKIIDTEVTDSTISPFSDKLLLYHTVMSNGVGIQNYGTAMSKITRHDVHLKFASLSVGIGKYVNKGMKAMIEHGWTEEPPSSADREKLSQRQSSD
ncbi:Protein of unknown function [Alteribacillus persepolensis]|uniref:DUF3231 family protein n=1 Tax=Alteribacillus persepolensis TaxID=568899 RepID=A0A1G8CBV7_9BACI|nr:DUF3231 family protein [Alteribacillus persepolensis]SDH42888.1 Protein of unknown function [Alteribacillus persepolensis]